MADLKDAITIATHGMKVQSTRMRVGAENIANADSTATTPGGEPYRRKTITFKNVLDRELGVEVVKVDKIGVDDGEFNRRYDPSHPAANAEGYVLTPNVQTSIERLDIQEAQRSYEANLSVIDISKSMLNRTLELMR